MMGTTTAEVVALALEQGAAAVGANCGTSLENDVGDRRRDLTAAAPGPAALDQAECRPAAHDRRLRRLRRHAGRFRARPRATTSRPARASSAAAADRRPSTCGRSPRPSGVRERRRRRRPWPSRRRARSARARSRAHRRSAARVARHRDLRGLLDGIAVDARRDRGERDRATAEAGRHLERAPVARGQQRRLAAARRRARRGRRCARRSAPAGAPPSSPSHRPSRSRRAARHSAEDRRPARAVDGAVDAASAEQRLVGGVDDGVDDLLRDVAERDLDASGHRPVSIDFADAPTPILPRRARFQPQDAREGGLAPGRHGVHRPRGRGRSAGEERRDPPERGRRAHGSRMDGADACRARQRHRHHLVLPRHPRTSSRAPGTSLDCIMLPKVQGPDHVAFAHHLLTQLEAELGMQQAHRARGADRERARRREPAGDRRRLGSHRDDHLRARRLRRRPRHPAAQRGRGRRRSIPATSGTTSSRASSSPRGRAACRRSTAPTRRSATSTASAQVAERSVRLGCDGKWALHPTRSRSSTRSTARRRSSSTAPRRCSRAYREATEGDRRGAVMWEGEMIDEASRKMAEQIAARGRAVGHGSAARRGGAATRVASETHTIQIAAATETWARTTHHGSWLCHWYSPMKACSGTQDDQREREAAPAIGPPGAVLQDAQEERRDDDVGRRDAHVHVGRVEQVAHAADVLAAGVRAGRRRERPADDQREGGHARWCARAMRAAAERGVAPPADSRASRTAARPGRRRPRPGSGSSRAAG